jgi:hypothetical protein
MLHGGRGAPRGHSAPMEKQQLAFRPGRRYTSLFRNAASPASDTSTHFLSGAASAT